MAAGDIHAFPNTEEGVTMRPPFIPVITKSALGTGSKAIKLLLKITVCVALCCNAGIVTSSIFRIIEAIETSQIWVSFQQRGSCQTKKPWRFFNNMFDILVNISNRYDAILSFSLFLL